MIGVTGTKSTGPPSAAVRKMYSSNTQKNQSEFEKLIDDFSKEIYWITPILDKLIIKSITSMLQKQTQ